MNAQLMPLEDADWIAVLRAETKKPGQSQASVAKRLQVSTAMISKALSAEGYPGDIEKLKEKVLGEILGKTVTCPVLGVINRNDCINHQNRPYGNTNLQRVMLFKACHTSCPHSQVCNKRGAK